MDGKNKTLNYHNCESEGYRYPFHCYSYEDMLMLSANDEYCLEVKFCPFCGFSMPAQDVD